MDHILEHEGQTVPDLNDLTSAQSVGAQMDVDEDDAEASERRLPGSVSEEAKVRD